MQYKVVIETKKGNRKDIIVKNKRATNKYKKFKPIIIVPIPGIKDKLRYKTHEELKIIPYQLKNDKLCKNHVLGNMCYEFIDFMYSIGYRYKDATTKKLLTTKELKSRFKNTKF